MISAAMSLSLAACGDEDEPADSSRHDPALVGKWRLMIVWEPEDLYMSYETYEFKKDGTFNVQTYSVEENGEPFDISKGNGTWETAEGVIYIKCKWSYEDDDETMTWEEDGRLNYRVTGDKLIFYDDNDNVVFDRI